MRVVTAVSNFFGFGPLCGGIIQRSSVCKRFPFQRVHLSVQFKLCLIFSTPLFPLLILKDVGQLVTLFLAMRPNNSSLAQNNEPRSRQPHQRSVSAEEPPEAAPVTFFFHELYGVPKKVISVNASKDAPQTLFKERVELS
jgi:hypothetical protein